MSGVVGNPTTVIGFQLALRSHVLLQVFDGYGREVATLVDGERTAGTHQVTFTARGNRRPLLLQNNRGEI